jgi:predicted MPP superfamily phosphohydrolase
MNILRMLIIFAVFILLNIYLFVRGWQALPDRTAIHVTYSLLFLFVSSSVFIAIFAGNRLPLWFSRVLEMTGGYWIMLFIFILLFTIFGDILRMLNHFFGIYPDWISTHYARAKLLYAAGVVLVLVIISIIGYARFAHPKITRLEVNVNHSRRMEGRMNIIAISDLHLGNLIRKERLADWVDLINHQKPDIILIAGDVFDHNMVTVELQQMDVELRRLNATYGVYAIPGNHDYYAGIDKALAYMKRSGINVLRDQSVIIGQKLILIGRDDSSNKNRMPLKSLVNGLDTNLPRIVMDHQPSSFSESIQNNIDLHLSGHTHNGQIFPVNLVVSKIYELGYGFRKTDNTHFYVSSGIGLWGAPIRFGTRSEIVSIVLKMN